MVNFTSAISVLILGWYIFSRNKKDVSSQLTLLIAVFLAFWAFASTMSDVMRSTEPALFWAQIAIIGPFFFPGFFLIFSYHFPTQRKRMSVFRAFLLMLPALVAMAFVPTTYNIEEIRLADWGTDFTPGTLYSVGILYIFFYLGWAAKNFIVAYREAKTDTTRRMQIILIFFAIAIVVFSLVLTNGLLPLVFNYTQASVFGPASSLFFVILVGYAVAKHNLLNTKVIATEFFTAVLIYLSFVQMFGSESVTDLILQLVSFCTVIVFGSFLVRSVRKEVERRHELQKLAAQLAGANEKLKEMDTLKSDFISIASHQLRTPTSVIKGYLSLMLDGAYGKVEGPMRDKVVAMADMAERLVVMINEMLNVSRIERNRITYTCQSVDIAETAQVIVSELENKAIERKIGLRLVVRDPVGTAMAYADNDKLKEALSNIVDNALKYSTHGTVEVMVQARPTHKDVLIQVSDEGLGIAAEDIKHMFEKFYRSGNPEVARQTGTGLGLYVCRIFLRDMGGDVWIERSALGKGTVFAITLPTEQKNPNGLCTFLPTSQA